MEKVIEFSRLGSRIGRATLVREKSLNSLTLEMINRLFAQIEDWIDDDDIACIVLDSSSDRAFCAGADITALYHAIKSDDLAHADAFFTNEYRLDFMLHKTEKPVLIWGNGVVMGGGLGLLSGCSHRVGTPDNRIAMPEITIGLFPDAGATWVLSGLPDKLGTFVGMTGCQLSAGDALELGILDYVIEHEKKTEVINSVEALVWTNDASGNSMMLSELLKQFAIKESLPHQLLKHRSAIVGLIERASDDDDFFDVFEAGMSTFEIDEWLVGAIETYQRGSATTARIFHEQLQRAPDMTLADTLRMELDIAGQCVRHPDFSEGVRALLVDKDRRPAWQFASTKEVPQSYVEEHFRSPWSGDHPLADLI